MIVFDGASEIIRHLAGKNRMIPGISPSKTWEGFIGGFIVVIITSLLSHNSGDFSSLQSLIFGLLICFSSFKEICLPQGLKEYSK